MSIFHQIEKDLFVTVTGGWELLSLSHIFHFNLYFKHFCIKIAAQCVCVCVCNGRGWNGCVGRKAPLWSAWFRGIDL